MKATLLAGLCLVLTGVIVGLASPKGSLTKPFEGAFRPASSEALRADRPIPDAAPVAPAASVNRAPENSSAPNLLSPASETQIAVAPPAPKSVDERCAALTEAARQGYMSAGYATQEFASMAIAAKADAQAAAKVGAVRDQYVSAMDAARTQVAAASRAQCWSKFGLEPPNLAAFATSLPSAASEVLAR